MHSRATDQTNKSRELRKTPTIAEAILWKHLRSIQLTGAKFRRQMALGPYFADFACPRFRCIIEIDGSSHEDKEHYDSERDRYMEHCGWTVLRFTEQQVQLNAEAVLEAIGLVIVGSSGRTPRI